MPKVLSAKRTHVLDLAASRNHPTIRFKLSQVEFVDDLHPTTDPDDTSFNDPDLANDFKRERDEVGRINYPHRPVLTDI